MSYRVDEVADGGDLPYRVVEEPGGRLVAGAPDEQGARRLAFILDAWRTGTIGRTEAAPVPAADAGEVGARHLTTAPACEPGEAWDGPEGATVEALRGGRFRVTFPRRPGVLVRADLKSAGMRWNGTSWEGWRLPAAFGPPVLGGGR